VTRLAASQALAERMTEAADRELQLRNDATTGFRARACQPDCVSVEVFRPGKLCHFCVEFTEVPLTPEQWLRTVFKAARVPARLEDS
jgi:hypothetical protein